MRVVGVKTALLVASSLCLLMAAECFADIYRYRDEQGVWHFTNIPTRDTRFKIYIREGNRTPAQYIKKFDGIIEDASRRFGLEPSLVKAVIKAESDFDHEAVSNKGAQGLMQLMPETAATMEVKDAFDPEDNIVGGTRYLSQLMERFGNNTELAIAAYNAGPEAVQTHGGIPPFEETKTFVQRVLRYYKQFTGGR
jgi:soluble lytic murein transglycosylase-like protein